MAYPDRGLPKAAMGHYLTESARTALEAMEPEEDMVELGPGKKMPVVGPNQLLDMPLYAKTPFLPGSDTLFYTTKLGEKLYQPAATFDLSDPYCQRLAPRYSSLHDPHLRAFYTKKHNLQRLKKAGFITDKHRVVCSLKEFNEYRQYLTSLRLEFEKHYIQEQKTIEKEVTKLQEDQLLPEAADTSKYLNWMLREERPTIEEQENVMRNRYLSMINEELEKLEHLAEENRCLESAQTVKTQQGLEKKKKLLLRKKVEEEWRKKEMMLLLKIGNDVKREARIEDLWHKRREEKLKRKHSMLEKKMAHHLQMLRERFLKEGFPPPDELFYAQATSQQAQDIRRSDSLPRVHLEGTKSQLLEQAQSESASKGLELPKGRSLQLSSRALQGKGQSSTKQSLASLAGQPSHMTNPAPSNELVKQEPDNDNGLSKKESVETASVAESLPASGKASYSTAKEVSSITSLESSNLQAAEYVSGRPKSSRSKVVPSASAECVSNEGAASTCGSAGCGSHACGGSAGCGSKTSCSGSAGCGSNACGGPAGCGSKTSCSGSAGCGSNACGGPAGCGSKTSCCGSASCGSKTSCCGSAGCGSKTSCCGSAGCGSKTSCCGSAGCGSKTSCCGFAGCGSKTSCCGSTGCCGNPGCCCDNGKNTCCGSGGCGSSSGRANPCYDSSGSSKQGATNDTKCPFSSLDGGNPSRRTTTKVSTQTTVSSVVSRKPASEGSCKAKQKKRERFVDEPEGQPKEQSSSKKRRAQKSKREPSSSAAQGQEGTESSYSAYVQHLLSNTDQLAIRERLQGKVSASNLNNVIENIMTWVVSAVTTILYPALTKFEERVRPQMYAVSEESVLSSDNSSSCSTCNEERCEIYVSHPCSSTRKVSFTDTSIKPVPTLSDFQTTNGKPTSVLSSSPTSVSKSTHTSQESNHYKRKFKRGKTAIIMSPSKYSGLLSTTTSVRSSKSDSHITQFQKCSIHSPESVNTASSYSQCRHLVPAILKTKGFLPKVDNTIKSEGVPSGGGEHKPPHTRADPKGSIAFKALGNIFAELKSYLTQTAAILLEDIFKRILGDLGFAANSVSVTIEVLLESISESLLGSHPAGPSGSGSISRIASFTAHDIVENIVDKLRTAAQRTYLDILSKNDFAAGCKATGLEASGKHAVPDSGFWKAQLPLSSESTYGIAEEIVEVIIEKLKTFATSSQTKLYQFELCTKIEALGIPLEQLYAAVPPHTIESAAANLIVKAMIRKIVSQTVASSETNIQQYVEEMISNILSYIQRQTSQEDLLPTRESSVLLQLINDVFNSLSTEKLQGFHPPVQSRVHPETHGGFPAQETRPTVTTTTLFIAEKEMKKPFPPVNVPGMVTDAEAEDLGSTETERTLSSSAKDQKVPVTTTVNQGKTTYESFTLESRQRSRASAKSAPHDSEAFLEEGGKGKPTQLEKTESNLDVFVQGAIYSSVEGEPRVKLPAEQMPGAGQPTKGTSWTLYQALKKMEDDFKEEEQPLLFDTVRKLLDDTFQHIWAAWPICPPAPPPPSLAHLSSQRHPHEEQPAFEGQDQLQGQTPISEAEVHHFAGDLVTTLFQKVSRATLADTQSPGNRESGPTITDILPLKADASAKKGLPTVHFKDTGMSFEAGASEGGPQPTTKDLTETKQPEIHSCPSKLSLANDLVQTFLVKLEAFVTSKVESQFCSGTQTGKTSTSSDFLSNLDQDLRKLLATHSGSLPTNLEDILRFFNNSLLEEKEKAKHMLPPTYSDLTTYAQEVARIILQNLKRGLDKEVEKTASPPIIISESIVASQIVTMVLAVFNPQDHQSELQDHVAQGKCVLEKLLGKNPGYKRDLQTQIQNTVESILNEIYQTILLDMCNFPHSSCGSEKFHTNGIGELSIPKTANDPTRKTLSKSPIAKYDVSVVSEELVDIALEDLRSTLAAGLSMKESLSEQLQTLVYDLVRKTMQPLAHLASREAKEGIRDRFVDSEKGKRQAPGCSRAEKSLSRKINQYEAKQLSGFKEHSPEGLTKSLVDSIFLRLTSFAEEKLVSELMQAAQWEKQHLTERRAIPTHTAGWFPWGPSNIPGSALQGTREDEASRYYQKAKRVVQDSQTNLRLCAKKLTCTILQLVQKDLEGEMRSSPKTLPYKDNATAHEMVNKLVTVLSVQIALTENEVQKRVLKRIFRRHPLGQKLTFPLLARVEDVLNQVTQRIMGDLEHSPSSNNDSLFPSLQSKSSPCHGVMETVSQVHAGSVASEIVDSVLHKMYSVVMDTLFSSSESKSEVESSSSNQGPLPTEPSHLMEASDIQKMTIALSQLQPPPHTLGEELVQSVLNKVASFAASNLEEILPLSAHQKWKPHWAFQCDMHAGDGPVYRPKTFSEDSESSLMSVSLSKSDLTIYAKDIVSKVLRTIIDEFKTEDYHRTILRVNTLSSDQISTASNLVHSIVQDLHVDDVHLCHLHKHPTLRCSKAEELPPTRMHFHLESAMKGARVRAKCIFHDEFISYLKQVLPKEGILKHIFEQQPLTEASIHESLKMLQVTENIVSEVFMRIQDLEPSICLLKRTPGELSERLFCSSFKRAGTSGLFLSDSQAEISSVARDIVANVFENVQKCLVHSVPNAPEKAIFRGGEGWTFSKGSLREVKHRFTQPQFSFYSVSLKASMDTIDRIAKYTVECAVLTLETFVARHFRQEFKCNFLEIVKFPLESLSFTQLTRSLHSLSTGIGNGTEAFGSEIPGSANERTLPPLGSAHNFLGIAKGGSAVTKEGIEAAFRQVQALHSELGVYANNAVSSILEMIKRTLDHQLSQKEATLFCSSSESLVLSETISVMLDRCTESLTEITSELMVENLQLEMSGQALAKDITLTQNPVALPRMKKTSTKYRRIDLSDSCPPLNIPGKVIRLEEEEIKEEVPCRFPSLFTFSKWDIHTVPERNKGLPCCTSAARTRWHGLEKGPNKLKSGFLEDDWLPRQRSIPKGSILEKLFNKSEESEAISRVTGQRYKANPTHCTHLLNSRTFTNPESTCYSPACPVKLTHTAEKIVNTLLSEFGLESDLARQASHFEKFRPLSPLKEDPPMGTSLSSMSEQQTMFKQWEKRVTHFSRKINPSKEESSLLTRDGSSLLSKWESMQPIPRSSKRHEEAELLACAHMPEPGEIQQLADHIVLCVIKEVILITTRDSLEEKNYRISAPPWKQKLQKRIWRSTYPSSSQQISSYLGLLWEPLTAAVISNVLANISDVKARRSIQERKDSFESTFCSVDSYYPEHGLMGSRSSPLNIEDLASQISKIIIGVLCEKNILQEPPKRKGFSARKPKYIYVPPLCLADFDNIYYPLVKEVANLLFLEIERRNKYGTGGNTGDFLVHHHFTSPCFSRSSRTHGKGPSDIRGTMCLSAMDHISRKTQRLSCIASNLEHLFHNLKTEESKDIVNKVLHIIFNSLQPVPSQSGLAGPFPNTSSQTVVPYQNRKLPAKQCLLHSSICPHACRLTNKASSNLGLSPNSVLLLDVVSEKLIRALLEKCLTTDQFTSTFAFDDFPEEEQICDVRTHDSSDSAVVSHSRRRMEDQEGDSNTSTFTYEVKYSEEPWAEVQSGASSYESALDSLAHTLVKPVMTELSLSIEKPRRMNPLSKKAVGFIQPISRRPHEQRATYGRSEACSSMPRGRKPEYQTPVPGRCHTQKNIRERTKPLLGSAVHHRTCASTAAIPTGKLYARKPFSASSLKKSHQREVGHARSHPDHRQFQLEFCAIYPATFLEEVISQLLVRMYTSLCTKYDSISCMDMREMNTLFVNALVDEFKKAGVGLLQQAEEKTYFPLADSQTINKLVDSILREFGFQLAAEKDKVSDVNTMAEWAAEIILMEILDYQLPPLVCKRLPKSVYRNVKAGNIIHRIEECFSFPKAQRQKQPPPAYITILSQKYLERVINQIMAQFFPPSDSVTQKLGKWEMSQVDFNDLCSYMVDQVMRSIARHKIWVAKKNDPCHLHSEKEIQSMVDSVYEKILEKSGSQSSIQKDVQCRSTILVDSIASFVIQEITNHHLQTFLSKDEEPYTSHNAEALSKNIVKTVLDSVCEPPASPPGIFPAKQLEEIVSKVLSKIFCGSMVKKRGGTGQHEADLREMAKRLANSINLQFGRATVMGAKKGEEPSLVVPMMDVMDDMVDSVCRNISTEQEQVSCDDLGSSGDATALETIKNWIEKGISDYLLHPLFSGDFLKGSRSSPVYKDSTENTGVEFGEIQDQHESRSPFNTFLSSGFLEDIITGLLSKIFSSSTSRDSTPVLDARHPSHDDIRKFSTQLHDDVRMKLLKHKIRVTKDTHPEQYEFSEDDVQNMTDSLCGKILQKAGSLEAVQRDMKNKSNSLIDRIAGFLIGDILKKHVQPFISSEEFPACSTATSRDTKSRFDIHRTVINPVDLKQATQERRGGSSSCIFREIVSGLFSKIADSLSDIPLADSGKELGDTAVRLAESLTKTLTKSQFNIQEDPQEKQGSSPEVRTLADRMSPHKDMPCDEDSGHTISFEEAGYLLSSGRPSNLAEVKCFIQKNLFAGKADSNAKPPVPYTTVLSYQIVETIIGRILGQIFPSLSSASACSAQEEGPFGSDFYNRIVGIKKDIMAAVLKQAIWISTYGSASERRVPEEAVISMVESVYRDLLHEVLFQQPLPQDREGLSKFYVTKIACFIMNEMFKYHLQSLATEETLSCPSPPDKRPQASHLTIFPYSLLEVILGQLLEKIFSPPESAGKQIDFSDSNFTEMAANLRSCVIPEICAHEIRLENIPERIPDMDRETEEDIANSVYSQVLHSWESQHELQNSVLRQGNAVVLRVANALIREILNYHICPFLSGSDSSKSICTKWQKEMEPRPQAIHSAAFLEDVIVAFFCQILSSPNIRAYSKDSCLSEDKLRERVIEQVHTLVLAFQLSNIKVINWAEECSYFPEVTAEEVIQISNTIYQKLIEKSGSELEIFKVFQRKSHGLAEQLIPLMLKKIFRYRFQPLFTGDTSPYLLSFLQADTIIDRVETILPDSTSSSNNFGGKFLKIIHRIFPLWDSSGSDGLEEHDPTSDRPMKTTHFTKHMKEQPSSQSLQTEGRVDVNSSFFLKDTFRGLISKFLSSTTNACVPERKGDDLEPFLKNLMESIFKDLAKSPAKLLQAPEEGHASPAVSEKESAKTSRLREECQVWPDHGKVEDLDSEGGQTPEKRVESTCAGFLRHSSPGASLYDDLTSDNEEVVDRLACYMVRAVSRCDFEPGSDSEDDWPYSTTAVRLESDKIIQKFLSDMELAKGKSESSESQVPAVSVLILEEILSRFLTKILLVQHDLASPEPKTLSKAEVNDIADQLKTSVEIHMSKNKINLVSEDQPNLHPEHEETVNQVVHSVFSNVLEKSGSQHQMYNDVRNTKVIFPDQVASMIVNEISSCSASNLCTENTENKTSSALELDRIVSKVIAQMGQHVEPDKEPSMDTETALPDLAQASVEEALLKEVPVNIVPYLGNKSLDVDPNLISDHLAVLSIKTESLEKLNKRCRSRTGVSLTELRKASLSSKSVYRNIEHQNENKKKERRPSLDFSGHLDVKPREIVCRNSFQCLMKPDLSRVQLLKDVSSKEDLMLRLIAHDIDDNPPTMLDWEAKDSDTEEEEEQVLQEETSFFFEVPTIPPAQDGGTDPTKAAAESVNLPKTSSSSITQKRSLSLSKCCPALSLSSSTTDAALRKKSEFRPTIIPQIEITPMASGHHIPSLEPAQSGSDKALKEAAATTPSAEEIGKSVAGAPLDTEQPAPATSTEGEPEEEALEKAVVGMHLSRDTEETPGAVEITSVYQNESSSEEEEVGQAEARTNPMTACGIETIPVPRQQSSRYDKISNTLSRVFSRTSTSSLNTPKPDKEKTDKS